MSENVAAPAPPVVTADPVEIADGVYVIPDGRVPLVERVVAPEVAGVPVRKGARLGRVEVYAGDRLLASSNLVAASTVSEPGALDKAWWYVETTADNFVELFS